jgi:3-methyladenine DNA glycosylase Mpg
VSYDVLIAWHVCAAVVSSSEGLVYLEGGTETAFRKAPKVGVEYDVPRLYRFYFKYDPMPAATTTTSIHELTTAFSSSS